MPLPFLKPKNVAGLIMSTRKPDGGKEETGTEGSENEGLLASAEDLIRAIHSRDAKHVALALRAAIDCLDSDEASESDSEGPQPHSYESQNIKAAGER